MAKFTKEIKSKAVNSLHEYDKIMYILYKLYVVRLHDIVLHDELYNYGCTVHFKFNWLNPITWLIAIIYLLCVTIVSIVESLIVEVLNIKNGFYTYFE